MGNKTAFDGLSRRARRLLARDEALEIEFKESVAGLQAEDLVAFANSSRGGAILIGVKERKHPDGRQYGEPTGHVIDDRTKLQIVSKALSCVPPVQIEVVTESLKSATPFYRLEIPSGTLKPYSTAGGTFKVREDGRNAPLLPEALLALFLHREAQSFKARFTEATDDLAEHVRTILNLVEDLESDISHRIEQIGQSLGWAEYRTGESVDAITTVREQVTALDKRVRRQGRRIRAIVHKVEAEDPVRQELEKQLLDSLSKQIADNPSEILRAASAGNGLQVTIDGDIAEELEQADIQRIFEQAVQKVIKDRPEKDGGRPPKRGNKA